MVNYYLGIKINTIYGFLLFFVICLLLNGLLDDCITQWFASLTFMFAFAFTFAPEVRPWRNQVRHELIEYLRVDSYILDFPINRGDAGQAEPDAALSTHHTF